jgi:hypothetical protein
MSVETRQVFRTRVSALLHALRPINVALLARAAALHDEAHDALREIAPSSARSHLATIIYIEGRCSNWTKQRIEETITIADYMADARARHYFAMHACVLALATLIGLLVAHGVGLINPDGSHRYPVAAGVGTLLLCIDLLGKQVLVARLKERRDGWRGTVAKLMSKLEGTKHVQ